MTATTSKRYGSSGRFEVLSWYFMRVTGALLLLVAVFHMLLMHVWYGVDGISYSMIIGRWASPWWQVYDLTLLVFAVLHGVNGARWVIDDYFHRRGWNLVLKSALFVATVIFLLMGAQVIFTVDLNANTSAVGAIAAALGTK